MPGTNPKGYPMEEHRTDPRLRAIVQEFRDDMTALKAEVREGMAAFEKKLFSRFVSYKYLIAMLGGALAVGMGLAGWVMKSAHESTAVMKSQVVEIVKAHATAEEAQVGALKEEIGAARDRTEQTASQVNSIYEAIVDGKIGGSPRPAAKAKTK